MMTPATATTNYAGFTDPVHDSQRVFRAVLAAMASPGAIMEPDVDMVPPAGMHPVTAAVCLCLLDFETPVWVSGNPGTSAVEDYLRFHCGSPMVRQPGEADFAVILDGAELPPLDDFRAGSPEAPHRSATAIVQVNELLPAAGWTLSGPGIATERGFTVRGVAERLPREWQRNHGMFPMGLDMIFTTRTRLAALPRTTLIRE